jgi:DNA-directed RNA polymerase subunit M/transcription elongation factor TFIIS
VERSPIDFVPSGKHPETYLTLKVSLIRHSSNLLYPKEDLETNKLKFVCKACTAVTDSENACTYRNHLGSTVTETAGVTTDVANDPTVGDSSLEVYFCTMCGDALRCRDCGTSAVEDLRTGDSEGGSADSENPS